MNRYMDRPIKYFIEIWMLNYVMIYSIIRKNDQFPRWYLDKSGHMNVLVFNILGLLILLIVVNAYLDMNIVYVVIVYLLNISISMKYNMNMIRHIVIP